MTWGRPCAYGDPLCPCQDGDACHYEGENPMTPPQTLMDRTAALEVRVLVLEKALEKAFGRTWLDLLAREIEEKNEPASE